MTVTGCDQVQGILGGAFFLASISWQELSNDAKEITQKI